jgi:putative intracellular protease/amidase
VLYDAVVLPRGTGAVARLRNDGRALEFIKDQYRHCKPILAMGDGAQLLKACGISRSLQGAEPDSGLIVATANSKDEANGLRRGHCETSALRPGDRSAARLTDAHLSITWSAPILSAPRSDRVSTLARLAANMPRLSR